MFAFGSFKVLLFWNVYKFILTLEVKFGETISQQAHGNDEKILQNKLVYCHLKVGI